MDKYWLCYPGQGLGLVVTTGKPCMFSRYSQVVKLSKKKYALKKQISDRSVMVYILNVSISKLAPLC